MQNNAPRGTTAATGEATGTISLAGSDTPYAGLTPDTALDAMELVGLVPDGRLLGLNSYENRVYQIGLDDGSAVVAKFYRPGRWTDAQIVEEHTFVAALVDAEIPVVGPRVFDDGLSLHRIEGFRFAVYAKRGGRAPNLDRADTLRSIGRHLGRIHAIGGVAPFAHRQRLDTETLGDTARDYVLRQGFVPDDLVDAYSSVSAQALAAVRSCFAAAGSLRYVRIHGDCHAGNILWSDRSSDAGPHFVDFDDACNGPVVQDFWMLLSGERDDCERQMREMLDGYRDFHDFDTRELMIVEALRTLRLLHYAGWIARRWNDPAFPAAFPFFNTQRYWQDRILELREQVALIDEPPLNVA